MSTEIKNRTAWLYYNGQPIQAVIMTDEMTEQDVRCKMLDELNAYAICNRPNENPGERRQKIYHGEIRYF